MKVIPILIACRGDFISCSAGTYYITRSGTLGPLFDVVELCCVTYDPKLNLEHAPVRAVHYKNPRRKSYRIQLPRSTRTFSYFPGG